MILREIIIVLVLYCSMSRICARRRYRRIEVRLEGGPQPYAGRVMVYYNQQWGSVCDNEWSKKDAQVVCRQLGYKGVVLATKGKFYGAPERKWFTIKDRFGRTRRVRGRIWLDRVQCTGREYNLGYCLHKPWGRVRCSRERLAGVMCDPGMDNLIKSPPLDNSTRNVDQKQFKLRLIPKSSVKEGIVKEGYLMVTNGDKQLGGVCSDGWSNKESRVACGELGFTHAVETIVKSDLSDLGGLGISMADVKCTGNEASLLSCQSSGLGTKSCRSNAPVWLKCETNIPPFAQARLRGGLFAWEGRVEVRNRFHWFSLCDKDLDIYTANVICRSLGYGTAKHYALGTVFPHATEDMNMYEKVECTGKETYLQNCRWRMRRRDYPCRHYSDAGVTCNVPEKRGKPPMKIRLAGITRDYLGRVEVNINGKWGTICGDQWTMKNAMVVCRQLGLGYATNNYSAAHFGVGGEKIMGGITCFGNETSLDQCLRLAFNKVTCSRPSRVAGVECGKGKVPDLAWDIKELASTMRIDHFSLQALRCAYEENCLAESARPQYENNYLPRAFFALQRRLLRFSAKIHNVGTAAYKPYLPKNAWTWHSCHRHYHSDEEFALYDLIDRATHQKVAEGHKASYCLEDTKCDHGVEPFFDCEGRGDQGISVNCHDNYDYTLDCQWVDITDLRTYHSRSYNLRLIANPSFKVGESDYSNNVIMCDIRDERNKVIVEHCSIETCDSGVRSHHGNGNYACCRFPFIYDGKPRDTCVADEKTGQFWCATTKNFDKDKLFGYC